MAFLLSQTTGNIKKSTSNLALHGITPNGTYFFCNLVYQKGVTNKVSILNLIDAYATTKDQDERLKLKSDIEKVCETKVEGIALLFSNSEETYGFVTGNRIKVAQQSDTQPLQLDAHGLFSDLKHKLKLNEYFVFILKEERDDALELIKHYSSNMDNIDAINYVNTKENPFEDMTWYLNTAYKHIINPILREQVKVAYDALQSLKQEEIKYQATVLILQLLHSQAGEKRQQLLTDYTKFASHLYGSKIPVLMAVGIGLLLLGITFLLLPILVPTIPLSLAATVSSIGLMIGTICAKEGKERFYSTKNKEKHSIANTLFHLKEHLNNIPPESLISQKINDPNADSNARPMKAPT
jgi:hypothetical protein